ncbi:MAG TPA: hypothetical protein DHW82_04840 [Spirochaetia bacterium]|nr:MAG: hypothetical protein A2Y41_12630 [Spirochaetes bacterium GWB1_36_13]HCL56319.1 hypothetical protein [Spirochaetia bacterium]
MKNKVSAILLFMAVFLFSCTYPSATLQKETKPDGEKILKITYPSPKMFAYDIAGGKDQWGIVFAINDYTQICFPPPGTIIDNRWFYYFGIVDQDLNPILKTPFVFEETKKSESFFAGQYMAVFPTEKGFLIVYMIEGSFYFTEFGTDGKKIRDKTLFYGNQKENPERNSILSIHYQNNILYLLLREAPEDIYTDSWSINLIKHDIEKDQQEILKKFIPNKEGWYQVRKMDVFLKDDFLFLSWIDGKEYKEDPENSSYKLSPIVYYAACPLTEKQCAAYQTVLKTNNYFQSDIRFLEKEGVFSLVIRDEEEFWEQKIGEKGALQGTALRVSEERKKIVSSLFDKEKEYPFQVIFEE